MLPLLALLLACPKEPPVLTSEGFLARHETPVIVAHRGASAYAPENTLAAYRKAIELGAVAAETDVQVTADGHAIVIHDDSVDRTTTGEGAVAALSLDALRGLDAGAWFGSEFAGERLPLPSELLDVTRDKMILCIELKAGAGLEDLVAKAVIDARLRHQVVVFSFDADRIRRSRALLPDVPALYLGTRQGSTYPLTELDAAVALDAAAIGFNHLFATDDLVTMAHARGLAVFVYTVDDAESVERVRVLGVDGIITNAPDVVKAALAR